MSDIGPNVGVELPVVILPGGLAKRRGKQPVVRSEPVINRSGTPPAFECEPVADPDSRTQLSLEAR